ncbi:hypothetical protein CHU98_g12565, partial [Xylaria longipes]
DDRDEDAARGEAEQQPTRPNPTNAPTDNKDAHPSTPPPADEYDERIADLERRLRERKAGKAARKAEKKKNGNRHQKDDIPQDRKSSTIPAATAEKPAQPIPTTTHRPTSNAVPGDFSSTMAKLRAAQREKERKRAEAEAAAAAVASDSR